MEFEKQLNEWCTKVWNAYIGDGFADTRQMIVDIDSIIAEAFEHEKIIDEY